MVMKNSVPGVLIVLLLDLSILMAEHRATIIVDRNGGGDFRTLTEAVDALPMFNYERTTIIIQNGVYNEKIRIEQDYITLRGESRDSTVIRYNQLREAWTQNKDSVGPAVINLHGDDIVLENLTVENTQPEIGSHAFAVYGTGTRTIINCCNLLGKGGDTVALWDYKTGMYYHADCRFEGAVDFVCPRGWCYIRDSEFFEVKKTAAIWHAGGFNRDQKLVLENCRFDGIKDFRLGRHHYEAQFYLLNCRFSANMADEPIYRVVYEDNTRNRPFNWGKRYYFQDCHSDGGDFVWFQDNLNGTQNPEPITAVWTFGGRWNPELVEGPAIIDFEIQKEYILLHFTEIVSVIGQPLLKSTNGKTFTYQSGRGSDTLRFTTNKHIEKRDLAGLAIANDAKLLGTTASLRERSVNLHCIFSYERHR